MILASITGSIARMASRRQIIGGLVSVLLHGGLLGWAVAWAPVDAPAQPELVMVERIEVTSLAEDPLAWRASAGSPGEDAASSPARGEDLPTPSQPEPPPEPPKAEPPKPPVAPPPPPPPPPAPALARHTREQPPTPTDPAASDPPPTIPASDEPASPEPPAVTTTDGSAGTTPAAGTPDGHGSAGACGGRMGTGDAPDYSAYGAKLVRLVKVEIDTDPVPGIWPHDSVEVELEVLPSGRLARHGLGKYDYAKVVRSTLGPVRLRALLRRILKASQGFPPHPESFPRKRYVVGFTVTFPRHG